MTQHFCRTCTSACKRNERYYRCLEIVSRSNLVKNVTLIRKPFSSRCVIADIEPEGISCSFYTSSGNIMHSKLADVITRRYRHEVVSAVLYSPQRVLVPSCIAAA